MRFRPVLWGVAVLLLGAAWVLGAAGPQITVYKGATCGCCSLWGQHLKATGFQVAAQDVPDIAEYKTKHGVPDALRSCHTAIVDGYVIEGHVPAAEILRLLQERPKAVGLAVPGMPLGSPGMEGSVRDKYSVLLFTADGRTTVYREYPGD